MVMNAKINLWIGELVRPHNFLSKLGKPTLQGIACCEELQQTFATIKLEKRQIYTISLLVIAAVFWGRVTIPALKT
jgi:hypothetical protein